MVRRSAPEVAPKTIYLKLVVITTTFCYHMAVSYLHRNKSWKGGTLFNSNRLIAHYSTENGDS